MGPDSYKWGSRPFNKKIFQPTTNRKHQISHKSSHRHYNEGSIYYSSQEKQYYNQTNKFQERSQQELKDFKSSNNRFYNKLKTQKTQQSNTKKIGSKKFEKRNKNYNNFDNKWQFNSSEEKSKHMKYDHFKDKKKSDSYSKSNDMKVPISHSHQQKKTVVSTQSRSLDEKQYSKSQIIKQVNQKQRQFERSFFIGQDCKFEDPFSKLVESFMIEIQQLNYIQQSAENLEQKFKEIVAGHIRFNGIYPICDSTIGKRLISNGLFHQMWGKILQKLKQNSNFWIYYQKYADSIQNNQTNFQSMFNQLHSQQEFILQDDSNTKLKSQKINKKQVQLPIFKVAIQTQHQTVKFVQQSSIQSSQKDCLMEISSKENQTPFKNVGVEFTDTGRIRLFGEIQSNQRRLNLEIIAFFLGITQVYKLQSIDLSNIIQCYLTETSQVILLEAYVHTFCQALHKPAIYYRPKLLLIAYGPPNLSQMLRLKLTYKIEGLVVYDEIFSISKWLKSNGYQNYT